MVSARAGTVLLIFEHFIHLATFSSATFVCFISFAFPLGFRADISLLCLTFECFVILLISFSSVRFPDGFRSRFTSTFVTHFVLTSFRSRFPLVFRALVFTLHSQVAVASGPFRVLTCPLAHFSPTTLLCETCLHTVPLDFRTPSSPSPRSTIPSGFRDPSGFLP